MTPRRLGTLLVVVAGFVATGAAAAPPDSDRLVADGVAALERGAFDEAIDRFEALADGGFVHPDASYDRAAAYLGRATSPQARPGDLGQVAAALAEVQSLRPDDDEARGALERVRQEIANRRVRAGQEPAVVSPSIPRAVAGVLAEGVWLVLVAVGSALLTLGVALRALFRGASMRLGAGVTASVGAVVFVVAAGFALTAGHLRRTSAPAVVVVPQARLLTADGGPVDPKAVPQHHIAVPEGATVFVTARRGRLAQVEWGATRAFVAASDLRLLAVR